MMKVLYAGKKIKQHSTTKLSSEEDFPQDIVKQRKVLFPICQAARKRMPDITIKLSVDELIII